ncbi:MAG: GAF domain-containing sensor histidine kinase, partial [Bermanella sp.]
GMGLWKVIFEIFGVNLDFIHRYFYVLAYLALDKGQLSWGQRIRAYGYYRLNRFYLQLFEKNHPANYGAHYALMLAEWHRSQGRLEEALRHYERAMVLSKKISLFNEALCHERLADLHERADRQQAALLSAAQARMLYQRWGNEQQVARIDSRYPQLPAVAGTVSTGSEDAATGVDGQQLDLLSLARGSMAISSEVKTEQLIEALLQQLLQTSGAQRAVLLLEDEGQLKVHGEMSSAAGEPKMHACAQPALPPDGAAMAVSVIHFVVRSKTCEVLDDAQTSANFSQDPYIVAHQLKSLLCMPIVSQGTLLGILYLENNLTRHAFTAQQQQVLTILAAQAAISMVNASLYSRLEVKVAERTQELHNTMDQLIESEKIAALGRVVAGIAHEINTPLGIALTSNSLLASDFSAINDQYHGGTMTKDDFENFLSRNHEALTLSTGNLTRVSTLVKRFKSTAAGHTGEVKVAFNLKEHLQGIVIGFAEELQAGAHGIVLDCADDVQMNSFPLALTLVMSNLINNSLQHGFKQRKEGTITLAVSASKYSEQRKIIIEYADDGVGIEQAQHKKVFDPFFTSSMGEHSGLGLHIVYNVISKQFGGSIRCGREEGAEQAGAYFYLSLSAD